MSEESVITGVLILVCVVATAGIIGYGYVDARQSSDYLGEGLYECDVCNWTGYVGNMTFHYDGFLSESKYYCPVCGAEIDVRTVDR